MGPPPDNDAKSGAESTNVDVVPIEDSPATPPATPPRTRSRSLPPPIPGIDRKKRPTMVARAEGAVAADRTLTRLDERDPIKRALELAQIVEATSHVDATGAAIRAYELGELHEHLGDDAKALAAYKNAVALDPSLRIAVWSLRRVLERGNSWAELAAALAAELSRATNEGERQTLQLERAIVLERAGDDAGARAELDDLIARAPTHQGALLELQRVVSRTNDAAAIIEAARLYAGAVDDAERKTTRWLELARQMVARDDERVDAAFDAAAAATAAIAGAHGRALGARIACERLRVAAARGTPGRLGRALALADAAITGERATTRGQLTARRREIVVHRRHHARLLRADHPEQAWELLNQAHGAAPEEAVLLVDLVELAGELGRHHELPRLVDAWRAVDTPAGLAAMMSCWCAEAHLAPEHRSARRALLAQISNVVPGFVLATSTIECEAIATPTRARSQLALVDAYRAAAEAARRGSWLGPQIAATGDAQAAATLWVQAAYVLAAYVATPASLEQARMALDRALEAVPTHAAAIEQYVELDAATGRAADAIRRLRERAGDDRAIVERAAGLAYAHGLWSVVHELERELLRGAPRDFALAWQLEATLARLGHDSERAELLAKLALSDPDPTRRRAALYQVARARERAGDAALAVDAYRKLLELAPDDLLARDALHAQLRVQRRWKELAAGRLREARDATEPRALRAALREAAWVLEVGAGDATAAATIYEEWLARAPGERTALEGAARCREVIGDHAGAVAARRAIVELDATPEPRWLYARSLERAGDHDAAAVPFRELFAAEEESVARACATLALADTASRRGDVALRVEVMETLAARTQSAPLAVGLHESNGWSAAIVLEDLERAQRAFAAALALEPTHQGALLGAALAAGRGADASAREASFAALAGGVDAPALSAALLVRTAAIAAARGHIDIAIERAAAARVAAPDHPTALVVAAELGPQQPPPGLDPFAATDRMLAYAELLGTRGELADDPHARASWQLDRAEALASGGELRPAANAIARVRETEPDNRRALWVLRAIARRVADTTSAARASYAIAQLTRDPTSRVQLLREAVEVYDRPAAARVELDFALAIYAQIVASDPTAPETERWLALLRDRRSDRALIVALTDRLEALAAVEPYDEAKLVELLVERASLLRRLDHDALAIADLDAALSRAPKHGEALRLRASVALDKADFERASALLWRYLATETSPQKRAAAEQLLALALDKSDTKPRIDVGTGPTASTVTAPNKWEGDSSSTVTRAEPPPPVVSPILAEPPVSAEQGEDGAFASTTARIDVSELQEQERQVARTTRGDMVAVSPPAGETVDDVEPSETTGIMSMDTAIGAAVGADVLEPAPGRPRLQPPTVDRALFATSETSARVDPGVVPIEIAFPDDRTLSPDDSDVVMLSFDELKPRKSEDAARLREYYEREVAHATDPAELALLRVEAGRACEDAELADQARAHYDAALVASPRASAALRGLRHLAWRRGDLADVTRTLEAELAAASPRERDALARYRIDVLMATGEQDLARVAVGELLDRAPNDVPALLADLELAFLDQRVDDERRALEQLERAAVDPPLRAALRAARAALAERLGDRASAIEIAYSGDGVASPAARLRALHDAVGHEDRDDVGAAAFELACELEGDDPIIAAALAVRACEWIARADKTESEATRELLATTAQLMARAAPKDPLVARVVTEAALAASDHALAAHGFARWVRCKSSPAERAYAAARAAELDPQKLGRLWSQVVELDHDDDYATAQLRAAHVAAGELQLAIELDVQLARDGERAYPLLRAAALLVDGGDVERAIALLERGREQQPASIAIALALADALARAERTAERAVVLNDLAQTAKGGVRQLACWRAALARHELARAALAGEVAADQRRGAVLAALDAWDAVLATDARSPPAHAAAIALADLLDEAAVLEAVLARAQAAERSPWAASSLALRRALIAWRTDPQLAHELAIDTELDDPRCTVAAMFAAAQRGDLGGAAAALEARAKWLDATRGDAPIEAATLRLRAAQLALDADQVPRARALLAGVARTVPGLADDLIDAAARRAGEPVDAKRAAARGDAFVRVLRDADAAANRGDRAGALALYKRALELRPNDPFAAIPMVALAWALRDPAPIAALAHEELRSAEATRDAAAKADAHELLARVDEQLRNNATSAEVALELALRADPSRIDLVPRLERHFATARRYGDVLRLRKLELDHLRGRGSAPSPRDVAALAGDAASLAARARRGDDERAALLRAVLDAAPHDHRTLLGLDAILRRAKDGGGKELAALYDRIATWLDDPLARSAYLARAGELYATAGRPVDAIARFANAFEATPTFLPALDAWHRTAVDAQLWLEVARAATQRAQLGGDPHVIAALHHFAAVTLLDKAGHGDDAMVSFRRALEFDPRHPEAFRLLRALLEASPDHRDELVALLQRRIEGEPDPSAQIALHRSLAELRADADERDLAVQSYRALLRLDPTDVRAHAAIADLTTDPRKWDEASESVMARIRLEKEPRPLATLYSRLGRIYAPHDTPKALAALQRALSYNADDHVSLRAIVDVAIAAGEWQLALDSCDRVVATERDAEQQALYLHRAATIFDRGFGDRARADRMLELACERAPTSERGFELLVQFFAAGDMPALRPHLDRLADTMRARIAANPVDGPAYRTLARATMMRGDGHHLIARVAAEVAELLGSAGDPERRVLAEPPRAQLAMLGGDAETLLFYDASQAPIRTLFRRAGGALAKAIGFELGGLGVGRKQRVDVGDPLAAIARDVARAIGLDDVHVFVSERDPRVIAAVPTSPVSLVLGAAIVNGHDSIVRFACGAGLALARLALAVPAQLAADQLAAVGAGLVRIVRADAPVAIPADEATARAAKLAKALPSRLVDELRKAGDAPGFDADTFARELWIARVRAGTCAAGSILPALAVLAGEVSVDAEAVLANPIARAVVTFALREHTGE